MSLDKNSKIWFYITLSIVFLIPFCLLCFFLKGDLFPKTPTYSSGSRSIGIQALSAFATTISTFILLFLTYRSDQRAKNSEMISSHSIGQTNRIVNEMSLLAQASNSQANALNRQNDLLRSRDVVRNRYSLVPIISKDPQGVFENVQLINMSSASLLILYFKIDGKDHIRQLISTDQRNGSNYIILEPNKPITLLDQSKFSGVAGDLYEFSIGIHYEKLGEQVQKTSFKLLVGVNGTATLEDYSDTNPSRPIESLEEGPNGSLKRITNP